MVRKQFWAKLGLAACAFVAAATSQAFLNPDILIERALNSPQFHIKYSGVAAAMVEVRVNGSSIGTQNVSPSKRAGEVTFLLDLLSLNDGDNELVVNLFDKNGKLLETQKMQVLADDGTPSPVKLNGIKQGSTVQGTVEIKAGFGREMRNAYVSFFIDEQFKSMTNAAPFSYFWDTTGELNGWHEVQAWVVDENSITYKTRKMRVFINNPGGRTERRTGSTVVVPPATQNVAPAVKPPVATVKPPVATVKTVVAPPVKTAVKPAVTAIKNTVRATNTAKTTTVPPIELAPALNGVRAITSNSVGLKPAKGSAPATGNAKLMTPKSLPTKLSAVVPPVVTNVVPPTTAAGRISIGQGTRLPAMGTFTIVLNSKVVKFDVQPRVADGIALAPIRHLFEANGSKVDWENLTKTMFGEADGKKIVVKIGDKYATVDELQVELEAIPFLENGRTIVPLSFIKDALQVDVELDTKTGHVLITSVKNKAK